MSATGRGSNRRADFLSRAGTLAIVRPNKPSANIDTADLDSLEMFVLVEANGQITAFNGHVDLGTGIRTALTQIVAEELDVGFARVNMVLGDTDLAPDQGATIASETIQVAAVPLRKAAAQARQFLVARAAEKLGLPVEELIVDDGLIRPKNADNRSLSYGDLIGGGRIRLALDDTVAVKSFADYRIVGTSQARIDLPAKATGGLIYVHDMRLPDMLHGRVVRPPYAGVDAGDFVGTSLISVDKTSIAHIPGIVDVVVDGDFVGIVAEREEQAEAAARALVLRWKPTPHLPPLGDLKTALRNNPSQERRLLDEGNIEEALESRVEKRLTRTYVWPYQMHASIGPSCALVDFSGDGLKAWSGTQNPIPLRADLARLLDLPESSVEVFRMEAAGCYGRNCADDVTADAALLSRAVGRPVRVQLTRDQEHLWEPKGAAQLIEIDGGLDSSGAVAAYDFATRYPSNNATTLALLLTGKVAPVAVASEMGDRTAIGPYAFPDKRVTVHDMAPIVRASWLRGVSALPNTFGHECYIDELATEAGVDPIDYRLRYLQDPRAIDLARQLANRVGWEKRKGPTMRRDDEGLLHGRGFAYALYVHSKFPGFGAAYSAWVADVAVDPKSGEVSLTKISVAQDSGLMINPDGVKHQIHGNVVQSTSRVLKEQVSFSDFAVTSREWGTYPLLTFPELPPVDVLMVPRPHEEPLGVGESASVPSAAAIANAIFDATGVRFREPPFTPDRILAGLRAAGLSPQPDRREELPPPSKRPAQPRGRFKPIFAAVCGAIGAIGIATLPFRPAIAPITRPDPNLYSASTIERGRALAHLGACFTCHTEDGGAPLAGGREIATPFGAIVATNITPDVATGIGTWSYAAFERAMREGVHRDGRHLYPAFPYTSFAKASDSDLVALYAFLMAQPAVRRNVPRGALAFPFNLRPLMSVWNTLFHRAQEFAPDPNRSNLWNRGAYLVEGLGHCSACHSPRNALGAEERGPAHLSGGIVEGWDAPALTALSRAPIPWNETALYDYLRTGYSPLHGGAAGPMAPVIAELQHLPDDDIRAMAHYLASFNMPIDSDQANALAKELNARANARTAISASPLGRRIFEGACAVCHEPERGSALFGLKPSLALNSAIHADRPTTLVRVILEGIRVPELRGFGAMPAFADHLDDRQIAELARYIRARFAADAPPWDDLEHAAARLRSGLQRR